MQPKLLRFIQDREYERVGDPVTRRADVRIVAATNHDRRRWWPKALPRGPALPPECHHPELPLREHPEDILDLAQRFLFRYARAYRREAREFSSQAREFLQRYPWPGNIRELQNVVERATILAQGEAVRLEDLGVSAQELPANGRLRAGDEVTVEQLERAHIEAILGQAPSLDAAARTLGIDASTLYRKRKRYGL